MRNAAEVEHTTDSFARTADGGRLVLPPSQIAAFKSAKALGLTESESFLLPADEVIASRCTTFVTLDKI